MKAKAAAALLSAALLLAPLVARAEDDSLIGYGSAGAASPAQSYDGLIGGDPKNGTPDTGFSFIHNGSSSETNGRADWVGSPGYQAYMQRLNDAAAYRDNNIAAANQRAQARMSNIQQKREDAAEGIVSSEDEDAGGEADTGAEAPQESSSPETVSGGGYSFMP